MNPALLVRADRQMPASKWTHSISSVLILLPLRRDPIPAVPIHPSSEMAVATRATLPRRPDAAILAMSGQRGSAPFFLGITEAVFSSSGDRNRAIQAKAAVAGPSIASASCLFSDLFPSDCRTCGEPPVEISRLLVCPECLDALDRTAAGSLLHMRRALALVPGILRVWRRASCGLCLPIGAFRVWAGTEGCAPKASDQKVEIRSSRGRIRRRGVARGTRIRGAPCRRHQS
jgi:hypothetical protein